ncbi:MAG: hypothetical protein RLZZ524_1914 [Pseudomonadota bacterium]
MNTESIASWYEVDAENRLRAVSADWDVFARANDGDGALTRRVLGRPLTDFLTGDATRMFVRAVFEATRVTGRPRSLPYRCDAPDRTRQLEMTVTPLGGGALRVEHRLLASEPRQRRAPLRALHADEPGPARWLRCSQCLRLAMPGPGSPWPDRVLVDDPVDASTTGSPPGRTPPLPVRDLVCPACAARLATG